MCMYVNVYVMYCIFMLCMYTVQCRTCINIMYILYMFTVCVNECVVHCVLMIGVKWAIQWGGKCPYVKVVCAVYSWLIDTHLFIQLIGNSASSPMYVSSLLLSTHIREVVH